MSKLYIVGHRRFTTDKALKNYLIRMSEEGRKRVKVQIYNLEKETTGDFISQEMIQNKRDLQLKGILEGSQLMEIIEALRSKVETQRPKEKNWYWEGNILLNKLNLANNEKSLSEIVGSHGPFLFHLEKSVEWYKTLLRARSFQGIPTGTFKKTWDTVTRKYLVVDHSEELGYFKLAQDEIRNEKKRNKKAVSASNKV